MQFTRNEMTYNFSVAQLQINRDKNKQVSSKSDFNTALRLAVLPTE